MAVIKTSVNLSEEAVDALRELSAASGSSMAEVLRRAISTEKYMHDTVKTGGKVLVKEANNNTLKEVVFQGFKKKAGSDSR